MKIERVESILSEQIFAGAIYNDEPVWVKALNKDEQRVLISSPTFAEPDKQVHPDYLRELL